MKNIWFVVPLYNEDEVLEESAKKLLEQREHLINSSKISEESKILFVDDGSTDKSWDIIETLHENNFAIKGIKLAKNSGQQNALFAGYDFVNGKCDALISFDIDLQDDIEILDEIIDKYEQEDFELILITHNNRKKDSFLKSATANCFYNLMKFLGANLVKNHSEYRLVDKKVLSRLLQFKETNLFLRGIIPSLTNKICIIETERKERVLGEPKYNFFSSLNLALNGITALTIKPIRLIFLLGFIVMLFSLFADTIELFAICLIGGLQLISIGLVGEYVAKVNLETKNRPKYFVEKEL